MGGDDFIEIEVAGNKAMVKATVFRPMRKGERLAKYYVKGFVRGK